MGLFPTGRSGSSGGGHNKGSRAVSVLFRIMQLISAVIVAGLVGRYLHNLHEGGGSSSKRVVYTVAIAGISILLALLFMLPLKYQFYAFPLDLIMFVLWMVAFGLLIKLGSSGCSSSWFRSNWSWAWGRRYRQTQGRFSRFGGSGCGSWRTTLAFTFIGGLFWLLSFALGLYFLKRQRSRHEVHDDSPRIKRQEETHINSGVAPVYPHENLNNTRETGQYHNAPAAYTQPQQTQGTAATYVQPQHTQGTAGAYAQPQQYRSTPATVGQTQQDVIYN